MKEFGIHDGAGLRVWSEEALVRAFGKVGRHYFRIVRGLESGDQLGGPLRIAQTSGAAAKAAFVAALRAGVARQEAAAASRPPPS